MDFASRIKTTLGLTTADVSIIFFTITLIEITVSLRDNGFDMQQKNSYLHNWYFSP